MCASNVQRAIVSVRPLESDDAGGRTLRNSASGCRDAEEEVAPRKVSERRACLERERIGDLDRAAILRIRGAFGRHVTRERIF